MARWAHTAAGEGPCEVSGDPKTAAGWKRRAVAYGKKTLTRMDNVRCCWQEDIARIEAHFVFVNARMAFRCARRAQRKAEKEAKASP
jgi:hypothetical protein